MLATAGSLPTGPEWAYEFKWDGVRALAVVADGRVRLSARSGADITIAYPELGALASALAEAGIAEAVLDGEIVVLDAAGRPSFSQLAERMHVRDPGRAARLAAAHPVNYMIFDVLSAGGQDLTSRPYTERRAMLETLVVPGVRWLVPPTFDDGAATLAASREYALEGVIAKRRASTYRPGVRSPDWIKVKHELTDEFVVGGWRPGARLLGALLIGLLRPDGRLDFRGRVGGGISAASERALLDALRPLVTDRSPFATELPREDSREATWVRPGVVVEIRYGQQTPDGRLRFPRFVRLRPDKAPADVMTDEASPEGSADA
jgi:bifunctional non-homologous end joining protein LigD